MCIITYSVQYDNLGLMVKSCIKSRIVSQAGFTLPELLVTGAVVAIGLTAALFLIHPEDHTVARRNAERWASSAQIAQVLGRYIADTGGVPKGVTSDLRIIGSEESMVDLCDALVPKYLKDIPADPLTPEGQESCRYNEIITGYAVRKTDKAVEVMAPFAEKGEKISVTREL